MADELYRKYRPTAFNQVFGQAPAVKYLRAALKGSTLPRQLIFTGPSGCGKTTLARIVKDRLDCSTHDFKEVNCADFRGIDMAREIRVAVNKRAIGGACRVWLIDEAHMLTKEAQNALLKTIEEPPEYAYFFLATTDPQKLLKTIQTRVTEVRTVLLTPEAMSQLLDHVLQGEERELSQDVRDRLIEAAEGSGRKALVILQTVLGFTDEAEQLAAILNAVNNVQAIQVARTLMNPKATWNDMSKVLKAIDEDPEGLRRMILVYASNTMLNANSPMIASRAYLICVAFSSHFFDTGRAGLIASCWEVIAKSR